MRRSHGTRLLQQASQVPKMPNSHGRKINDIQRRRHDAVAVQACADGVYEVSSVLGGEEDAGQIGISSPEGQQVFRADF